MASNATLDIVINAQDRASGTLDGLAGKLGAVGSAIGAFALAGGAAFGAFAASSVGVAASFEKSLSSIEAVSGATAAEMEKISALSLQLGADTAFSAGEAAAGLEELIKGGLSTADAMAAAHPMLNLAAAGGIEVAAAAEIAANALGIFGLKGADMTNVANQIAGAANASSLSVSDFQYSMAAAGSVAAGVGQSFDDLATAIAVMGKSGIKGSDAGTSLKTMLMNLQPTTKAQVAIFEDLGITAFDSQKALEYLAKQGIDTTGIALSGAEKALTEYLMEEEYLTGSIEQQTKQFQDFTQAMGLVNNEFVNADGSFKSMAEIADVLQEKTGHLTDAQRALALETMFGSDAIRAANIFVKEGAEGFDAMATSMGKVTAESVAATRLDNFSGAIDAMKGSLETFQIVIGTALLPVLTTLVKDHLTPIINNASTFATAFFDAGDKMGFLVGKINEVIPGFATLVTWLQVNIPVAVTAAADVWNTTLFPALTAIGGVITGTIIPAFTSMVTWLTQNWTLVQQVGTAVAAAVVVFQTLSTVAAIVGTVTTAIAGMGTAITAAGGIIGAIIAVLGGPLTIAIGAVALAVGGLYLAWQTNFLGIQEIAASVWSSVVAAAEPVIATLTRFWTEIQPQLTAAWQHIQQVTTTAWAAIQSAITTVAAAILSFVQSHMTQIQTIISGVWTVIQGIVQTAWALISGLIKTGLAVLSGDWQGAWNTIKETVSRAWQGIQTIISGAMTVIQSGMALAWDAIRETATAAWEAMRAAVASKIAEVVALAGGIAAQVVGALSGLAGSLVQIGRDAIQGLIDGIKSIDVGSVLGGILRAGIDAAKAAILSNSPSKLTRDELGVPIVEGIILGIKERSPDLDLAIKQPLMTLLTEKLPSDIKQPSHVLGVKIANDIIGGYVDKKSLLDKVIAGTFGGMDVGPSQQNGPAWGDTTLQLGQEAKTGVNSFAESWSRALVNAQPVMVTGMATTLKVVSDKSMVPWLDGMIGRFEVDAGFMNMALGDGLTGNRSAIDAASALGAAMASALQSAWGPPVLPAPIIAGGGGSGGGSGMPTRSNPTGGGAELTAKSRPMISMGDIHIHNPRNAEDVTNGLNALLDQAGDRY